MKTMEERGEDAGAKVVTKEDLKEDMISRQ